MRWAILYDDGKVWLEWNEDQIKRALLEAFKETQSIESAFERVRAEIHNMATRN